jgi:hypothetical protein
VDKKINVLIYPCGAENGLEILLALKDIVNIKVFGASGKIDHGALVFENYIPNAPFINQPDFVEKLNAIIDTHDIHFIFPTHDDLALELFKFQESLKAIVTGSGFDQAVICRSKRKTYELFKSENFCPKVYDSPQSVYSYPLFAKPDKGQGGKGAFLIHSREEFSELLEKEKEYVVTEYLEGEELTVDCFSDQFSVLRFVGPRTRGRVLAGISVNSKTVPLTQSIKFLAEIIHERLKMRGLWYFQIKKDGSGNYKLLEVSIRASGTMNLYRGLGINFPLLTIYDLLGYQIEIVKNDYELEVDRAFINRYKHPLEFKLVYLDFDDTVTKNGKVNSFVMMFIYNLINQGKRIKLITKHEHILQDTFDNLGIKDTLFEEIIHLAKSENKVDFIKETEGAIFIDNSFSERIQVKRRFNIPVFDVDAISTLVNWKE